MPGFARSCGIATMIAGTLLIASCARHVPPATIAAAPEIIPPRPVLSGQFASVVAPPLAPDGGYRTINHGIDPLQVMWHVRAALNVAAIGCRGPEGAGLVLAYNALLKDEKSALAKANDSVQTSFRIRFGAAGWQDAHDQYMTRLYNFFAQPFAKPAFCATAADIAAEAVAQTPAAFAAWSLAALPRLEAPFLDGYRQIDAYNLAAVKWDARYNPGVTHTMLADAAPSPAPALVPAVSPTPQLAYADMTSLIAWEQPRGTTFASR